MTTETQHHLLRQYADAVAHAPDSLHLTSERDRSLFWDRHVLDAVAFLEALPAEWRKKTLKAIDVGTGNGIPGIVAAILYPEWQFDLLDSNNKKCGFIDTFLKFRSIKNAHVIVGRAEDIGHKSMRERYDFAFARALGKLSTALELASPLVKVNGFVIVPHGTTAADELIGSKKAMKELNLSLASQNPYKSGDDAHFVSLQFLKVDKTLDRYPRANGIPAKRPL